MPPRTRSKASALQIAVRNAVERRQAEQRLRYQCDLLQFWRRCRDTACRRKRSCIGDAYACFDCGFAAMSEADREWLRGAIMATLKGAGRAKTRGELIRRIDAEIAAARRAKPMDRQELAARLRSMLAAAGQEARLAAVPAQHGEPGRKAGTAARLIAPVAPRAGAKPDNNLDRPGMTSHQDESELVEWSPMIGSSVDPLRTAALPSSPGEADESAAEPSPRPAWRWTGPLNPPQATCDEQGRLIMPDRTEYNERIRKGMSWVETEKRDRG